MKIRMAELADAERLREIYAWYVENTAITFEYEVPSQEEFRGRIAKTLKDYPYLVLEEDGLVWGYAYAGPFVGRAAYRFSCEVSIYLDHKARGRGYGRRLYEALEEELSKRGIRNLYACIGDPIIEDETLTRQSEEFHGHMGYVKVGEFHRCGYKFRRWYNMIWMEKFIAEDLQEQIDRIRRYESLFDQALARPEEETLRLLEEYYSSGLWLADYTADEKGLLPPDLKRGVLSQDGLYDLLESWNHSEEEE